MPLVTLLNEIQAGQALSAKACREAVEALLSTETPTNLKAAFLSAQMTRGLVVEELVAFAQEMIPRAVEIPFARSWPTGEIMDCCGTGGGGLSMLNVSTGIVFMLAAGGVPIIKHGNRGVTKKSGSADVWEALGLKIELTPAQLEDWMVELGYAFVYAPSYHPAFKAVAEVRRSLAASGQKTIFNFLGPLLNPARPAIQLVGVFQESHVPLYERALLGLGCRKAAVIYGCLAEGIPCGEVACGPHSRWSLPNTLSPENQRRFQQIQLADLMVKDAAESARRLEAIFCQEEISAASELMILNAAVAFYVYGRADSLDEGITWAHEILVSGAARRHLEKGRTLARQMK
jgi:anthranilate phosphoribosyltransferase